MKNQSNSYIPPLNVTNDSSEILSVEEVSEHLRIGKNRTYELLNTGRIKGFRIGSIWKISKAALETYIRESSGL